MSRTDRATTTKVRKIRHTTAEFPRVSVVHDITEAEKLCPHDGTQLVVIDDESAERYDYCRGPATSGVG